MIEDKTLQARFTNKHLLLARECTYGLTHFCDGTPNKSIDGRLKPRSRCPDYPSCKIRKQSIYDEKGDFI